MNLVAFLTDFGLKDNFAGIMKAVMHKINPRVKIIDITHGVYPHDIREASFLLMSSFIYFPKKTVFLVVVDPSVGSARRAIAVKTKNYYFLGPDNGALSMAARADGIEKIVVLENKKYFLPEISSTFHGRDIFASCAAHLSRGVPLSFLGRSVKKIRNIAFPLPKLKRDKLKGEIIYIDKFGNLVTNIKKGVMEHFLKGREFIARLNKKEITGLCFSYTQGRRHKPFFIEGGFGYLEVSLKEGSAQEYFKLKRKKKAVLTVKRAGK